MARMIGKGFSFMFFVFYFVVFSHADDAHALRSKTFGMTNLNVNSPLTASQGDLDSSFNGIGYVITHSASDATGANAVALQPDGKIVVTGYSGSSLFVARYLPDGRLDPDFGTGLGFVSPIEVESEGYGVAIHDGKIIVVGHYPRGGDWQVLVVVLNDSGALDTTFGGTGYVTWNNGWHSQASGVAIQDGKILVTGFTYVDYSDYDLLLLRYNWNGTPDISFGPDHNGVATVATMTYDGVDVAGIEGKAVAVQSWDGKIVALAQSGWHAAIFRFDGNGNLDTLFGVNGMTIPYHGSVTGEDDYGASGTALALQRDHKILMAGIGDRDPGGRRVVVLRYTSNGYIDTAFGSNGEASSWADGSEWSSDSVGGMAVQDDGKIIVAGTIGNQVHLPNSEPQSDVVVLRFTAQGALDSTFGVDGVVFFNGPLNGYDGGSGVVLQPDGKIVVAGVTWDGTANFSFDVLVLRLIGDPPKIHVSPSTALFDFGNVVFGNYITQTFTVTNTGGMDLDIGQIAVTGTNKDDFVLQSDTCSNRPLEPVATGDSCSFQIRFAPRATGPRTAMFSIPSVFPSSDPVQNPYNVTLQGNGTTPGVLSVTPGDGLISSGTQGGPFAPFSKICTLQNTGEGSINWSASKTQTWVTLSSNGGTLNGGDSTTVTVSINSSANSLTAGLYSDTVTFTNTTNGNGNTTRGVSLTVTSPGVLSVTPGDGLISSGTQGGPFSPSSKIYTLQNTGGSSINWTASKIQTWVTLSSSGGTLNAGDSTTVTVSINSSANSLTAGLYSDTVTFTNTTNGNGNTTRGVSLTVTSPGVLSVTPATVFSSSGIQGGPFSPSSKDYTLQNTGETSIDWTASKAQTWVTLSNSGGTLAAGATTTVTVSINSGANSLTAGSYSDTVTFTNTTNGTGNTTRSVSLTVAPPISPRIGVDPDPVVFGGVNVEDEAHKEVTISNSGTAALVVTSSMTVTGGDTAMFGVSPGGGSPCPNLTPTIGVGGSCTVTVKFAPTSDGAKSTTLRIQSNDPIQPTRDVSVTGTGVLMPVTPKGTVGSAVLIRGVFDPNPKNKPKVLIGGQAIKVGSWNASEIRGTVSKALSPNTYNVTVQQKNLPTQNFPAAFAYTSPVIETVSPKQGRATNVITIQGFYFGAKGKIYVGTKSCKATKWNMISTTGVSEVQFAVPKIKGITGPVDVILKIVVTGVGECTAHFTITP